MFTVMDALSATTIIEVFFCKDVRDKRGGSIICFFPSFCSSTFCVLFLENYFLISSPFFLYNHKTHSYFYPFNHLLKIRIKKKEEREEPYRHKQTLSRVRVCIDHMIGNKLKRCFIGFYSPLPLFSLIFLFLFFSTLFIFSVYYY